MEMIKNVNELAEVFYNRLLDDKELNGSYDETAPDIILSDEISNKLEAVLSHKEAMEMEDKIFNLTDMYNKEYFIEGFKAGISATFAILNNSSF